MEPSVYLAGPISGCTYGAAVDWREAVTTDLARYGIACFSPMRAKEYLADQKVLTGHPDAYTGMGLSNPKGICTRDRFDCQRCDLVLLNLLPAEETEIVSIGSMIEVGWCDSARNPLIVVMNESNVHYHAMVTELAGYIVRDVESAVLVARAVLKPSPSADLRDLHLTPAKTGGNLTEQVLRPGV
jgi:nucleoside 2-deoxyribosyltransferase